MESIASPGSSPRYTEEFKRHSAWPGNAACERDNGHRVHRATPGVELGLYIKYSTGTRTFKEQILRHKDVS